MKATKITRDKETKYKQTFMENEDIFFADATQYVSLHTSIPDNDYQQCQLNWQH